VRTHNIIIKIHNIIRIYNITIRTNNLQSRTEAYKIRNHAYNYRKLNQKNIGKTRYKTVTLMYMEDSILIIMYDLLNGFRVAQLI
jgi:hypothetical protein